MNLPEPQSVTFTSLFAEIDMGAIKIPQFQREFVWSRAQSAKLLDSVIKGYPIGTFIIWKTTERLRSIRDLGNVTLPQTPEGDAVKYVLDGQQRLTSLYVTLNGLTLNREDKKEDYSKMWVNLGESEDGEIVTLDISDIPNEQCILLKDLLHGKLQYLASFPEKYTDRIQSYQTRIKSYQFSVVLIKDAPLDVATEIFTRLNVGGRALTTLEIMIAKTYDEATNFDLSHRVESLQNRLREVGYGTIPPIVFLQTVSMFAARDCRGATMLKIPRSQFVALWEEAENCIISAVEYFRGFFRIPVSHLLPYPALCILFALFFRKHKDKPSGEMQRRLSDFFWRAAIGGRYSQSLESRLAQDALKIDEICEGKLPKYEWSVDVSTQFISQNGQFSANRAYIKALLCVLAYHQPKSFNDNSVVHLDNSYLKRGNSKNYHHFFPKSWLKKCWPAEPPANHIANITLVDDYLNKRVIRAKSPLDYMNGFIAENPDIHECMDTHLIGLGPDWGVMDNDYGKFFKKRCEFLSAALNSRIIMQDSQGLPPALPASETEDPLVEGEDEIEDEE